MILRPRIPDRPPWRPAPADSEAAWPGSTRPSAAGRAREVAWEVQQLKSRP
jgi:hypothetical protein